MKIAAIICEYNPFHHGHAALFRAVCERLGEDSAIVCILGGNFVQRGEGALFTKQARAEMAIRGGADLVLELPFPHSAASAERFACAGVHIAASLGCVDTLAFGAEDADAEVLGTLAGMLESDGFRAAYLSESERSTTGCAAKTELVFKKVYGKCDLLPLLAKPNNLLAVEYIRALLRAGSGITPMAFPRIGAPHGDARIEGRIFSASAARASLCGDEASKKKALCALPSLTAEIVEREISCGKIAADAERLLTLFLLHYRLTDPCENARYDALGGGLAARFHRAACDARTGAEFFSLVKTKKYTDAYLRRALLSGYLGVTRDMLNAKPAYTQLLGMTARGEGILAATRKTRALPILTKPADYRHLSQEARQAALCAERADALYCALLSEPGRPSDIHRFSPYREKA